MPWEGGGTPYNGLYGEAPPERDTLFKLQVYKREGISLVEVYERVGKSIIVASKKASKGLTCAFYVLYGCEKVEKTFRFNCDLFKFQRQKLKGHKENRYVKGAPLIYRKEVILKGYLFWPKWHVKY